MASGRLLVTHSARNEQHASDRARDADAVLTNR